MNYFRLSGIFLLNIYSSLVYLSLVVYSFISQEYALKKVKSERY